MVAVATPIMHICTKSGTGCAAGCVISLARPGRPGRGARGGWGGPSERGARAGPQASVDWVHWLREREGGPGQCPSPLVGESPWWADALLMGVWKARLSRYIFVMCVWFRMLSVETEFTCIWYGVITACHVFLF